MLIICNKLNMIVSLKKFDIKKSINPFIQKELDDMDNRIMARVYNYGSTENAERASKLEQYRYLENVSDDKKYVYRICINGNYELLLPKSDCDNIYKELTDSIKKNLSYFDITDDMVKNNKEEL